MSAIRRASRVLREEGVGALLRRATARLRRGRKDPTAPCAAAGASHERERREYERLATEFRRRMEGVCAPDVPFLYWYHTVDLGGGLVTPGDYDFRGCWRSFGFPDDMAGLSVLDVGSATGFFAFEFERRGADVVSVELPSLAEWDMVPWERAEMLRRLTAFHGVGTLDEADHLHLHGPFRFCADALGSRVRRCYSTVYGLTPGKLGRDGFDLVFLGDLLLHLISPLEALAAVAPLCRGTLVLSTDVMPDPAPGPAGGLPPVYFLGIASTQTDNRSWWGFSDAGLSALLKRVGFGEVAAVGEYSGVVRRAWQTFRRRVYHARR